MHNRHLLVRLPRQKNAPTSIAGAFILGLVETGESGTRPETRVGGVGMGIEGLLLLPT
jgi:hypothetical protein